MKQFFSLAKIRSKHRKKIVWGQTYLLILSSACGLRLIPLLTLRPARINHSNRGGIPVGRSAALSEQETLPGTTVLTFLTLQVKWMRHNDSQTMKMIINLLCSHFADTVCLLRRSGCRVCCLLKTRYSSYSLECQRQCTFSRCTSCCNSLDSLRTRKIHLKDSFQAIQTSPASGQWTNEMSTL